MPKWVSRDRGSRALKRAAGTIVEQLERRLLLSGSTDQAALTSSGLLTSAGSSTDSSLVAPATQLSMRSGVRDDSGSLQSASISSAARQVLLQGLNQLNTLGPSLVGGAAWSAILPLAGQSIGSQVNVAGLIASLLQPTLNALNGTQSLTTDNLVSLLQQASLNAGTGVSSVIGSVVGGLDSTNNQLLFDAPVTATHTATIKLDAGQIASAMGIAFGPDATVTVTISVSLDITFGANLNAGVPGNQQFFVRLNNLTGSASINASNLSSSIDVGFLKASIVNGSANLNGRIQVSLNGGDSSGDVTYAQLVGTPPAQLFGVQTTGSASANLPVTAALAGLSISGTPTITLQSSDPFSGRSLAVSTNSDFAALNPFENASPSSVFSLLQTLVSDLNQIGKGADQGLASALLNTTIPFSGGKTVRDLLTLGQAFQDKVIAPLSTATNTPNFTDAQSLLNALSQALGSGTAASYDPSTHRLTFQVNVSDNFSSLTVPMSFDLNMGALGGISSSSNVRITPGASLNMTVGIDLTPSVDVVTGSLNAPADGRLPGDAHFTVDLGAATGLNGVDVPIAVTVPADPTNQSIDDLVSDINTALVTSGLGGLVIAGRNGNRITLGTTFSSVGASLGIQVTAGDPAATVLGFVNGSKASSSEANSDRLFIQNASAKGTISLTTPSNVNASAHYGFLGVAVNNGTASANAEADMSLNPGALSLSQIAAALVDPATLVSSLNVSGSASASLPISVTPSIVGVSLSGTPTLQMSLANITNPAAAVVTAPQLGNLSSLANMSFANAMSALNQLVSYLQSLAPLPEFGGKLPLINKSVDDLLGYSQKLLNVLTQIANSPDTTLQALSTDLNSRLQASGVHTASIALSFDNDAIKAAIHYQPLDFSGTEPFSLSLQDLANLLPASSPAKAALNGLGDIAQVGASGSVTAEVSADLELDMGIRLTTDPNDVTRGPFTPFIYDSSHISLTAQLDATNLNANVNLGPVGLFIVNGSAHLTKETNPSLVESPAEIGLTLPTIAGHRYYFDQVAGVAQPVLQGQMSLDLPLAAPTVTNSIGDLTAFADLSNIGGTIDVTAPDLADAIGNFSLLSNLGVIVDGLDSLLGVVSDGLDDLAFVKDLPLVGDHLQDAFTFIDDLRSTLRNTLEPLVQDPGGDAIAEAQQLIAQALGNALSDTNGDGQHNAQDIPVTTGKDSNGIVNQVEFEVPIDEMVQTSVPFDLGLPALNLSASGSVIVTADFHLDLRFGVSAADGFFIDTDYPQGVHAVSANVSVSLPATLSGVLGFLHVNVSDLGVADGNPADSTNFSAGLALDLKTPPNLSGSDIPFTDLVSGIYAPSDLASVTLSGSAAVNLRLAVDFGDEGTFPHIQADLHVNWGFDGDPDSAANAPSVSFDNVRLELGTFVSNLLGPVMSKIQDVLNPIMPVLNFLNSDVPVVSDIAGTPITWAEVLIGDGSLLQDLTGGGNIDPNSVSDTGTSANFSFIKDLITVDQLANEVPTQGSDAFINLGSFSLAGDDLRNPDSDVSQLTSFAQTTIDDVGSQLANLANDGNSDDASDASFLGDAGNLDGTNTGFDFPLFDDPTQAFRLLLGQDVSLVTFTPPQLNFNKNFSFSFSPFWPLSLTFGGDLSGTSNIEFGYDTHGLRQFLSDQDPLDLLDGFYASSTGTENGTALPELSLHMDMYVSGGVDADVASLEAKGQLNVDVDASLNDPNHDGKVHADEMAYELKNQSDLGDKILSIVDITGSVGWSMDIEASVGPISKSFTVASGTILDFDTNQVLEGTTLPDRFEPNDTQATAADLGVAPGIHVAGMSLHAAADKDFYKFEVVRPGSINITLNYQSSYVPGQIEYDVLDSNGDIVATGRGSGDNVVTTLNNAQPGTYYLKVFGAGQSVAGAYSLAFDPAPGSNQHVYYVNDGSTSNSYYTSAVGNDSNSATDPSSPKATIQAILSSYTLGPNDIIVVDSGIYSAVVSMAAAQAGVAIYGSPQNQSILQNTQLTFAGGGTLLYGFAINNTSVTFTDAGGTTGGIVENDTFSGTSKLAITGSADIESNTFNTSVAPAIDVSEISGKNVKIIGNTIGGPSTGIEVDGSGAADIEKNTVNGATFYGIEVSTGNGALISANTVSLSNGIAGIRVSGDNSTIQNNTITGSATYAIDIFIGDGEQVLNNIINGPATGIFSGSTGPITVNDNQISNTSIAGINLASTVSADVKSNTINPGNGVGIEIGGGTAHTVSQNNLGGRGTTAIWLQNTASGSLDYNVIASGYATDIEIDGSGSSDLSYNQLSSATTYGIYFTGAGSHSVSRNTGSTSNATAVIRADGGINAIEDNTFTGNAQRGVYLDQTAYGQVDGNSFGTLSTTGIEIDGTGLASITGNSFTGASVYGIYVPNSASVTAQNNTFSTSSFTAQGIRLDADTGPAISGNTLTGTALIGIHLDGSSTSSVTGNSASGAITSIELDGTAAADVENNIVSGSSSYGIDISAATSTTILNNQITASSGTGIEYDGTGTADVESNQVQNTRTVGVNLKNATTVTLLSNQITNVSQTGISASASGAMDVESNTVSGSTTFGIVLNTPGTVTLKSNQVQAVNGGQGIQAMAGSVTTLYQNGVSGAGSDAIKLSAASVGPVTGNTVAAGTRQSFSRGLVLVTSTSGAITGNSTSGAGTGIEFDGTGSIDVENNTLTGSTTYGLYAPSAVGVTVLNNTINTNGGSGVWLGGAGTADIENNPAINGTTVYGIFLPNVSGTTIKNNGMQMSGGTGIQIQAGSGETINGNTITGSGSYGIYLTSPASGVITHNTVAVSNSTNIRYDSSTIAADVENNTLSGSASFGIDLTSIGGTVLNNTIAGNSGIGIEADGTTAVDIEGNSGSGFNQYGIRVTHATSSTINGNGPMGLNGAQAGIEVDTGATTITSNRLTGTANYSIYSAPQTTGPIKSNVVNVTGANGIWFSNSSAADIENNTVSGSSNVGIYVPSATTSTIVGNSVSGTGSSTGIRVDTGTSAISDNTVAGAGTWGIYLPTATTASVIDNDISGQTAGLYSDRGNAVVYGNKIHNNVTGAVSRGQIGGSDWSDPNLIYNNTTGVSLPVSTTVQFNRLYGNGIAIAAAPYANINHNVIYRNTTAAILASGANNISVVNNTIYSPTGDSIRLVAASANASIENNILWSQAGYDLYVSTDSISGLASDYNNLYTTGTGTVAFEVIDFTDILDWMLASGQDTHSIGTTRPNPTLDNPQFVNLAADDYHLTNVTSTSIDAGDPATPYNLEPVPNGGRVNLGAYGDTPQAGTSPASYLYLDSPRMYVDWVDSSFQYITWHSFNVSGNIDIEVDKEGVGKVADIAIVPVSQGQYLWSPQSSGLPADDSRYRIKITSVSNPTITTLSREAFAVPNQTHSYYVNDGSTTNDVYATATGDNRNTGTSPADPKPSIAAVLRPYDLGAQDTIYVDAGHYIELQNLIISGIAGIGDDEGVTITGPTDPTRQAILDRAYPYNGAYAMELDNADFTTIKNLTLTGGEIGLWVENDSTVFTGTNLTVTGNLHDGLRIESDCVNPVLDSITATNNGRYGIYADTTVPNIEHSTIANNADTGLYLVNPGAIEVGADTIYGNGTGIFIVENSSPVATVGDANLSDSTALGNQVYDNAADGIDASGSVVISGNAVFGQAGAGRWGINFNTGPVSNNDVFSNTNGIISFGGTVTANRVYANSGTGIYLYYGSNASQNDVYSNSVGIYVNSGSTLTNNIVYSNSSYGIQVNNASGTHLANNTVYQPAGDAVHITSSSNVDVRNNILWAMTGADLYVGSDSQVDFTSDYNDLVTSGSGVVGNWQGLAQATIAVWRNASFTDADSLSQDPLFVSPAGADGQLGYVSSTSDGRDDDFHLRSAYGAPTGSGSAPVIGGNGLPTPIAAGSITSAANSPVIDRGDPSSPFNLEPAPNGGYIDLGAYGDTAQASRSPSTYVRVISPDGGEVWPQDQTFTIEWRTETTNPQTGSSGGDTYSIELMKVGSSMPVLNIASGVTNAGQLNWTVPSTLNPEGDYEIRITRNGTQIGTSDQPFTIASPIHLYYVNDSTVNPGDYTTAPGNDANDGLSPATPKASIRAVLAAYHLTSNDVVLVDAGTYVLNSNIVMTSDDSGVTIRGYSSSTNPNESTLIERNNTSGGSYGFELQGASGITLENLDISGAQYGIYASSSSSSENVTISNDTIHGNSSLNVYLQSSNDSPTLNNNNFGGAGIELDGNNAVFTDNTLHDSNNGAWIISNGAVVTGNTAYNISTGSGALGVQSYTTADIENNVIYNSYVGIFSYALTGQPITVANNQLFNNTYGATLNGNTIVTNNQVYGNTSVGISGGADVRGNFVYFNATGIYTSGLAENNYVYDNTVGIASQYSGPVAGNHVYDNVTGITAGNGAVTNNLLYGNGTAVYLVAGASGGTFDNNSVIQSNGQNAVVITSHPNYSARNNIFDITTPGAHAYNISIDSENGFDSDYNDFDLASGAAIGIIGSTSYSSLASWNYQLNLDRHSSTADPQFVANQVGADGILGAVGGLNGAYYSSTDLSGTPVFTRVDTTLGFGNISSPGGGISGNGWSARWTGDIDIPTTGSYTFYAVADDGVQIFLDGSATPLIGQWTYNGNATDTASIALTAGLHSIEIDYHQLGGSVDLSLAWAGPGFVKTNLTGNFLSNQPGVAPGNYGLDDTFAVAPGSPTIDAGDPSFPYLSEPIPDGSRINLGYTGNTSQATTSNAATVQVLMPNGLEKLTAYDPVNNPVTVPISVRSTGLTTQDTVIQLDAGSSTAVGSWLADAYHIGNTSSSTIGGTTDLSKITTALAPASVYTTFVGPYSSNTLSYLLPVPYDTDNSYRLTLEFVEPYVGAGQRTFNIEINGTTVVSNYDIAAAAGGTNRAVEVTLPVTAVAGQGIRVDLVQTSTNNAPILCALALAHVNPSGAANPTVSLAYSIDGGSTYIPIASGIPLDSTGSATYNWQVPATYTNDGLVKVTSDNVSNVSDASDQPFLITPATTTFYINDGSQTGDVYTTASGNDANTGKSPDSPMASLSALLAAYGSTFRPGDIIEIDTGYYPLQSNIVLTAAEQGMAILGPNGAGAVFDRQSTSGGSEAFMLSNAKGLTLENLSMTGGQDGIVVPSGSYSDNVSIIGCNVYNNSNTGIYFDTTNDDITLTGNTLWGNPNGISLNNDHNLTLIGNTVYNASNTGIFAEGQNVIGTNNVAYNDGTGMWFYNINPDANDKLNITGNVVYGDYYGLTLNGVGTASGNTAYDNTNGVTVSGPLFAGNTVYRNSTGIINQGSTVTQNRVYLNGVGITTQFGGTILGNTIYDNTDGISSAGGITINNNLVYDNTQYGIWLQNNSGGTIENNTIVQTANDDIRLDNASGIAIENNILENAAGFGIEFTDAAESGTHSDYNLFNPTGSGAMVNWGGTIFNDQRALTYATGEDQHSHVGDPGFVDPAGADGILGYLPGGLTGTYYTSTDMSGMPALTRIDSNFYNVNFSNNPPAPGISASTFSARWTGYIDIPVAGTYTFNESSDDGIRFYLDGSSTPVIDQWNYDSNNIHSGTMTLVAGWQPIEIDYHNVGGGGALSLSWSGPSFGTTPIFDSVLSPNPATLVGGDYSADDNFHLAAGSIAIDAGDPLLPCFNEPANNGVRADQGAYGNTPGAFVDPAQTLQVLSPGDLQKLQRGQTTNITWQLGGVGEQPVARINSGGGAVGNYLTDTDLTVAYSSSGFTTPIDMSLVSGTTPMSAYQNYDYAANGAGSEVAYQLPVPDGTYTVVFNFADDGVNGPNQRTFNILLNGQDVQPAFDIYAAAGGRDKAIDKSYTFTVTGGAGLHVELVNTGVGNAIISGLELYRNTDVAVPTTTELDISTDNGQTWHTITTNALNDSTGHGSFTWDPTGYVTNGNTAIIRAISGGLTAYSDGTFLIAPAGNNYYVNDSLTGGDVYSTAPGNNANSGKTPGDPVASISVLLDNYNLTAGDTIYVDTGVYNLYRTIVISASDSGVRIIGPTGNTPTATSYRDIVDADQPTDYYRLGEAPGSTTAVDLTGNNNATYSSGVTLGASGPLVGDPNTAASFDGVSGHVTLPSGFADFSNGLTFEFWAYPTLVNTNQAFIELGDGSSGNRIVFGRSGITNNLIFQIYNGTSLVGSVTATNAIALNAWQNFAVTMTPAGNGTGNVVIYKNGIQFASGSVTMPAVVTRNTNFLGQSTGTGDRPYAGLLDEVAIYSKGISDIDVLSHYLAASRPIALIDRGSINYDAITINGASNVDIETLDVAGGHIGIDLPNNVASDGVTIRNSTLFGNRNDGAYVGSNDNQATISGNEMFGIKADGNAVEYDGLEMYGYGAIITGNNLHDTASYGLFISAGGATITNNELWNNPTGGYTYFTSTAAGDPALVSGNTIFNNSTGLIVYYANLVSGNTAYFNSGTGLTIYNSTGMGNTAYGNGTGIYGGGSTISSNVAYSNTTGIASDGSTISSNKSYSNSVGIDLGSGSSQLVMNNLVYANTEEGIWMHGGSADRILNNTVDQAVGDALRMENVSSVTAHNNILVVQSGRDIYIASIGAGVDLDYNDLLISNDPNASIGLYNGVSYTTLSAWQAATGRDAHSIFADPKFVDPDGADNILGVATNGSNYNGGADDNFSLSAGSPAIDSGDSWNAAPTDAAGNARQDDAGTANAGSPEYYLSDTGSSQFTATGSAQNWHGSGGSSWTLNLPFAFSFFGQTYSVVYVSADGFVQLGSNSGDISTAPSHINLYPKIAALWDSLSTSIGNDDIYVSSSASQVMIRWAATRLPDNTPVNFSMTLFANGQIRFDYGSGNTSLNPVIGLFRGDGLTSRIAGISGSTSLINADSLLYTTAPGYTDMGTFEFRGSSTDTTGPTILATTPPGIGSGTLVTTPITTFGLTFSEPINPVDALASANYDLRSPGPDGVYGTPDDVIIPLGISYDGAEQVTLTPLASMPVGAYRLTVRGSAGAAIHDLSGNSLDGDNNGLPGGDYVRNFLERQPNSAPVLSPIADGTVNAGSTFTTTGSFTDHDAFDSWTATVNYGDGSGTQPLALNSDQTFNLSHLYGTPGNYLVSVSVTDAAGATANGSFHVVVADVAPTINFTTTTTSSPGGALVTFAASATSPATNAVLSYTWFVTRNGVAYSLPGSVDVHSATFSFTPDTDGAYVISLTVSDQYQLSTTSSVNLTVTVVAQPLVLSGNNIYLKADTDHTDLDVWIDSLTPGQGTATQKVPLVSITGAIINGLNAGNTITLDESGGLISLAGGITVNGGTGSNSVYIIGSTSNDTVALGSAQSVFNSSSISYQNVNSVTYSDGGGNDVVSITGNIPVTVNTSAGNDTISLAGSGAVAINTASTGGGVETVSIAAGATPAISLNIASGTISIPASTGTGIRQVHFAGLNIGASGKVVLASSAALGNYSHHANRSVAVLDAGGLNIASGGTLDMGDNDMILKYAPANEAATKTQVFNLLARGITINDDWSGTGITSSEANYDANFSIGARAMGFMDNNNWGDTSFDGVALPDFNQILIKFTYYGDVNCDGIFDSQDVNQLIIGRGHNPANTGWENCDLDYDGVTSTSTDQNLFFTGRSAYQTFGAL